MAQPRNEQDDRLPELAAEIQESFARNCMSGDFFLKYLEEVEREILRRPALWGAPFELEAVWMIVQSFRFLVSNEQRTYSEFCSMKHQPASLILNVAEIEYHSSYAAAEEVIVERLQEFQAWRNGTGPNGDEGRTGGD